MPRELRLAHNEALFRQVNERIAAATAPKPGTALALICECASVGCVAMLNVPLEDYRWIREQSRLFVIAPGHSGADGEILVGKHAGFDVVERPEHELPIPGLTPSLAGPEPRESS